MERHRCGLSKSIHSFDPADPADPAELADLIENNGIKNEDPSIFTEMENDVHSWTNTTENKILSIHNNHSFFTEPANELENFPESVFATYQNYRYYSDVSQNNHPNYIDDIQSNWNNTLNSWIDSFLDEIWIDSDSFDDSENYNANISDLKSSILPSTNESQYIPTKYIQYPEDPNDTSYTQQFAHLWVQCESCFGLNYKKYFKSKLNICEHCG